LAEGTIWQIWNLKGAYLSVKFILVVVAYATVALGGATQAQESIAKSNAPARPAPTARPTPQLPPWLLLQALDANHDGIIDADELADASTALEALDKNGDGRLTADEYQAASTRPNPQSRRPPPRWFPGRPPASSSLPQGGLGNFGMVDDRLLRGAQPSAVGIQTLKVLGVTTIVDLTVPDTNGQEEKNEAERNGLAYTNFPMVSVARPTRDQVNSILSTITNATGRVFIHCQAGKDRTGTVVACYRMVQDHWSAERALREADEFRMAEGVTWFREFVRDFDKSEGELKDVAAEKSSVPESDIVNRLMQRRAQEESGLGPP
jgi:protein tyrosine phosphatase (PTP) superfamily phosphohydrolase (DUF442 family)